LPSYQATATAAKMDPSTLVACFDASFSPNANIRIASELELRKVGYTQLHGCMFQAEVTLLRHAIKNKYTSMD
jgi:hypothetical protein